MGVGAGMGGYSREARAGTIRDRGSMRTLQELTIMNFKSIREQRLHLNPLNVFIGSNGSGKSNLIEVFRILREIVNQNLAGYTARKGGADALLHYGRKASRTMQFSLDFGEGDALNGYFI